MGGGLRKEKKNESKLSSVKMAPLENCYQTGTEMVTLSVKHCSSPTGPLPDLLSPFKGQIFRCVWLWSNPAPTESLGNF